MDKEATGRFAGIAMEVMKKATIQGADVAAYSEVWNTLNDIGTGAIILVDRGRFVELEANESTAHTARAAEARWASVRAKLDKIREEQSPDPDTP